MDTRERILKRIGSWPVTHWVGRKLLAVKWRRMHKVPEVRGRLKALSVTAPHTVEQYNAFVEYAMALQKELEKSRFSAWPPGSAQIEAMLQKLEKGNPTASENEEFRRLAGEVLQNRKPSYSPAFKKRIESALSSLDHSDAPPDGPQNQIEASQPSIPLDLRENDLRTGLDELSKRWRDGFQREGVKLETKLDSPIPIFRFDYQKVLQAVANFLNSALYDAPFGGSVTLNCLPRPDGVEVSVTVGEEQHQEIPDRHSSISPSRRQNYKYEESLAIGLTIVKRLIFAHRGKIWVEASSTGSRYAFLLPMDQG